LIDFSKFNCTKAGKSASKSIKFHEAYTPYVILGDTAKGKDLTRKSFETDDKGTGIK